ncbi:TNF superfamily member 10, like [Scyliorhinus canicula]|uniref:TNF superfamily member 10, like n=1 Tax=Scyliorhinus canicula TaxID=7830 RepID=UPI0018F79F63|nr:TNF superfamily member 10, like [Scyliorhinus canicula]
MAGQYSRSSSSESSVPMIRTAAPANSTLIVGAVFGAVALLLSIVSTAGMFVYFTREISKVKNERVSQELWCLNSPQRFEQLISTETEDLSDQIKKDPCWRLANSAKLLATKIAEKTNKKHIIQGVMDNIPVDVLKSAAEFNDKPARSSSAHLTVRLTSPQDVSHHLDQSCRHLVKWGIGKGLSHIQNMTLHHGKLRASQTGRYYIYAQTYFRYQHKARDDYDDDSANANEQQLVQCIYKMTTTYASPILLMKGVGTKCAAANAEYGLNSIYQGGLFELKAGDEIFVTISDIKLVDDNVASSYFGSFRLDM